MLQRRRTETRHIRWAGADRVEFDFTLLLKLSKSTRLPVPRISFPVRRDRLDRALSTATSASAARGRQPSTCNPSPSSSQTPTHLQPVTAVVSCQSSS